MQEPFFIRRVAILGAGVMGAQIAAHCVNAGIETLLYDLEAKEGSHNAIVEQAILHLKKLKPSPLGTPHDASLLIARNYADDLAELATCHLIIEVIAERLDLKEALYQRITPVLNARAIVVSNTSGLSIRALADALPESQRERFCGVHFFNPPRYMHLAELIPAPTTSPELLDNLETWLTSRLGKGVVRAKDTPNFIANRIGVFSLLATLHYADVFNLGLDEVDALTGPLLGRPKSATFRTMDVVGLDTMQHVVHTMQEQLQDDPWRRVYRLPDWLTGLIQKGALGQKTGHGIYRKQGSIIEVFDVASSLYRPAKGVVSEEIEAILRLPNRNQQLQQLLMSEHPQAKFLVSILRDLFHYSAYHLEAIADTVRDVDLAIRWGFGWQTGPFETWQAFGIKEMRDVITLGIKEHLSISDAPLPDWLKADVVFYRKEGAIAPSTGLFKGRSALPVYTRQFFFDKTMLESSFRPETMYENEGVTLWHLQDDVAVVSFKSKANCIGQAVLDGLEHAIALSQRQCQGLIIYQNDAMNFSAGADLKGVGALLQSKKPDVVDAMIGQFQRVVTGMKYASIPIVAALRGRALGGGCEILLHSASVIAAFESYPGLVEMGVGLIPAGGGCKEMALRAACKAEGTDIMAYLSPYFEQIARAVVAGSAPDARRLGYLQAKDVWVMHRDEVLYAALARVKAMLAANYHPPIPSLFKVAGREGRARLQAGLVNWREGGFISAHDFFIASQLAYVLCGGDVNADALVDENWMFRLEKEAFMLLAENPLTQARIRHMLETGKPLRN